jgi:hypothetical protein
MRRSRPTFHPTQLFRIFEIRAFRSVLLVNGLPFSRFEQGAEGAEVLVNGLPFFRFEREDAELATEELVNGEANFQLVGGGRCPRARSARGL